MEPANELEKKLKEPLHKIDICFNIAGVDKSNRKARVSVQVKPQAILDRLDELMGINGWTVNYIVTGNIVVCKLSLRLENDWISKEGTALSVEPICNLSDSALANAAIKFGIGRQLLNQSDVIVDFKDKKPEHPRNAVHYYDAQDIVGWWEEPDVLHTEPIEKDKLTETIGETDFKKLNLVQKLDKLIELGIITEVKHVGYRTKIEDKTSRPGLLRYFEKQFNLLYDLHYIAINHENSADNRATFYKRIRASQKEGLPLIKNGKSNPL